MTSSQLISFLHTFLTVIQLICQWILSLTAVETLCTTTGAYTPTLSELHICLHVHVLTSQTFRLLFKIEDLYCRVHNSYIKAVVGDEILKSQAPPNNAQKIFIKKITQVRRST